MISLISIYIGGVLTLLMALFHTRFYKIFSWEIDFKIICLRNKKIFYTIHIFLLINFIVIGIISLLYADELSQCIGIAFGFNLLISMFWLIRAIWQIIYFNGKAMHYILIFYFFMLFIFYIMPIIINLS